MVVEPGAPQPRLHGSAVCAVQFRRRRDSSSVAGKLCRRESQHVNQGVGDQRSPAFRSLSTSVNTDSIAAAGRRVLNTACAVFPSEPSML